MGYQYTPSRPSYGGHPPLVQDPSWSSITALADDDVEALAAMVGIRAVPPGCEGLQSQNEPLRLKAVPVGRPQADVEAPMLR